MNKTIATILAATALSTAASSVLASDYSDEVKDIKISVSALERQLETMGVDYNTTSIESGLNRAQEVKALEGRYSELQAQFNNAHFAN
jgi:hypothetical protein